MKHQTLSTQAWQVEATESMWSILRRFIALDRPTIKQCIAAVGHGLNAWEDWQWMLYRPSLEPQNYEVIRKSLKLSKHQIRMATLAILPMTHGGGRAIRFCQYCLENGFHSSLFQIPWLQQCPIHGQLLRHTCWGCNSPLEAAWDSEFIRDPFTCRMCLTVLGDPLGTAVWPMRRSERMLLYRFHRQYESTYESFKGFTYPTNKSLSSHWDLMRLALSDQQHETLLSSGTAVGKVYGSHGREAPKPIGGREYFRDADETQHRWEECAILVATWKSFRRHQERLIPKELRARVNWEKYAYGRENFQHKAIEGPRAFLTWRLLWQFSTDPYRKGRIAHGTRPWLDADGKSGSHMPEDRAGLSFWRAPCLEHYGARTHEVVRSIGYQYYERRLKRFLWGQTTPLWAQQHAFSAYLIALRDEAFAVAGALLDNEIDWPYYSSPLEGRLASLICVAKLNGDGEVTFSAWRSVQTTQDIDSDCHALILEVKQELDARREAVDQLRT